MSSFAPSSRQAVFVHGTVGDLPLLTDGLRQRGFEAPQGVASLTDLVTVLRTQAPALVFVPLEDRGPVFDACVAELRRQPTTRAIAVAPHADPSLILTAMRAGIAEFLTIPLSAAELQHAITRLCAVRPDEAPRGQVVAVYSAKGGVGTSTIAAALSLAISRLVSPHPVSLVDFNTAGAGLRVMLNLQPLYDLSQVAKQDQALDREFVRSLMIEHPERVSLLSAADDLETLDALSATQATALLDVLRQEYAFTVIDTDHHFNSQTMAALDTADKILLVTQLDVAALRSAQRSLQLFAKLGYPDRKIEVIANRCTALDRISVEGAERVLNRPIIARLPNDYFACSGASTDGAFVQCFDPTSELVPAVAGLAAAVTGQVSEPPVTPAALSRSRWKRLWKR